TSTHKWRSEVMHAVVAMNRDGASNTEHDHPMLIARHTPAPSGRACLVDTSTELLRTIAEVLDIRHVFPRVSEIVKQVLPHDALALVYADRAAHITLEARSVDDLPADGYSSRADEQDFSIVND